MKIGTKLQELRKAKGLTQEDLAEYLRVSRQSVSKWEQDATYPETDKLIKLANLYDISLDILLNPSYVDNTNNKSINPRPFHYEFKSKKTLFGLPVIHINLGKGLCVSKGIISIGNISFGLLSIGFFSLGLLSFAVLGLGIISIGVIALGLLLALGSIALGTIAIGAIAIGIFTIGALSLGYFSYGALSIAKYVAIGDNAKALIALGKTEASGTYPFVKPINKSEVLSLIDELIPKVWKLFITWIKKIVNIF